MTLGSAPPPPPPQTGLLTRQTSLRIQLNKVGRTLAVAQRRAAAALDEVRTVHVMLALVAQLQGRACVEQCEEHANLQVSKDNKIV